MGTKMSAAKVNTYFCRMITRIAGKAGRFVAEINE